MKEKRRAVIAKNYYQQFDDEISKKMNMTCQNSDIIAMLTYSVDNADTYVASPIFQ